MAVYHAGTLKQAEEKSNPYMNTLLQYGLQSSLNRQKIEADKRVEASKLIAQDKLKQTSKTRDTLTATWQALSDKPENEQRLFMETPHGKEYLKTVKTYLPELFDDKGKPVLFPSTKNQIKQGLETQVANIKTKALKDPGSLTDGERAILQMSDDYKDEFSQVVASIIRNPEFQYLKPREQQEMLKQALSLMKSRGANKFQGGLARPRGGGITSPSIPRVDSKGRLRYGGGVTETVRNQDDRLGILGD